MLSCLLSVPETGVDSTQLDCSIGVQYDMCLGHMRVLEKVALLKA